MLRVCYLVVSAFMPYALRFILSVEIVVLRWHDFEIKTFQRLPEAKIELECAGCTVCTLADWLCILPAHIQQESPIKANKSRHLSCAAKKKGLR